MRSVTGLNGRPLIGRAILLFAVLAPLWTIAAWRYGWLIGLAPLLVSHMLILYPTLVPNSQCWGPVLRGFATDKHEVWLTIDDGPTGLQTNAVLDLLDRYQARATFFVIGRKAAQWPEICAEILRRGHQIANHTLTHASGNFWCALPEQIGREIDGCNAVIAAQDNPSHLFFRAPAGLKNCFVHPLLGRRGMSLIGWTTRGFDTSGRAPEKVAGRIAREATPGAIVLLHEGHRLAEDSTYNLRCIELTLQALSEAAYRFVIPGPERLRRRAGEK
jgi:peptidoglycan/xylan/chitin deacetylase (PgdA/CDA1 family)